MDKSSEEVIQALERPSPHNFDSYLPWAAKELLFDTHLIITKVQKQEKGKDDGMKSAKSKIRDKKSILDVIPSKNDNAKDAILGRGKSIKNLILTTDDSDELDDTVVIHTIYDHRDQLVQLKFDKNKMIPRKVFKLIGLVLPFHEHMTSVTINRGLKNECIHELEKLLAITNITEICLDGTALRNGYYDILLRERSKLKNLSLSRCNIDDAVVNKIAIYLTHSQPASKILSLLNLASNFITDVGAKYLAQALRTNRQLVYLNISDNKITDEGAGELFDVLTNFEVTHEEIISHRTRHVKYLMERNELISKIINDLKSADEKDSKKKPAKPIIMPQNVFKKSKDDKDVSKGGKGFDSYLLEKAKTIADSKMGEFLEPYCAEYVYLVKDKNYCLGNNRLAYINISYNNIGYITVKKILSVLLEQSKQNRKPRGLVNICLEGNCIPVKCRELDEINYMLSLNLPMSKKPSQARVKM